jgi:tetratricopeptide (TPR) repeat protein
MSRHHSNIMAVIFITGSFACVATLSAQTTQSPQGTQSQPAQPSTPNKPATNGSSLDIPAAPANSEESQAVKAFQELPTSDMPKKIEAGEDFLKKYPDSQYRPMVYSTLTIAYLRTGNTQKALEVGDKEVALKPDDVQTLALLGETIPRAINGSTAEPAKQLDKAESYAKRAIEVTPTIAKPEGMTDQTFMMAKNGTLAMAHSGLGLVYFRRGKFSDAIPELEQSVKIDPNPTPDPVNLYLLGLSNQKASHFDQANMAFTKCASIAGNLQAPCRDGAEEAKKQASTQLSAPK